MGNSLILSYFSRLGKRLALYYRASGLCAVIAAAAAFFGRLWNTSLFRHALITESSAGRGLEPESGVLGRLGERVRARAQAPPARLPSSVILSRLKYVLDSLPHTTSRSLGLTLFCFALAALPFNRSGMWFYVLCAAGGAGLFLVAVNRPLSSLLGGSRAAAFIGGLFGLDEPEKNIKSCPVRRFHVFYGGLGLLLGMAFALLDLNMFVLAVGGLIGTILILYKTEVGVYAAAFLMPLAPTKIILGVCVVTVLSYFIKLFVIRGGAARFSLGLMDVFAAFFAVTLCYSVVISYRPSESLFTALSYLLYILFYFVSKNTLTGKRMIAAALSLLAAAGLLVALYGIYQQYTGNFMETASWIDVDMFEEATARIYSTLGNPNVLGEYLIFVIAISGAMVYYFSKPAYKAAALCVAGASAVCMVLTQSRGAWLGLIFAAAAYALMADRKLILFGIIALLLSPLFLPETVINRFLSIGSMTDSSTSYRVNIWLACLDMLKDVWFTGIGPGEESFRHMYQLYSFNAVEAPHSHNLYLQVIIDTGVFGFLSLSLALLTFFKCLFARFKRTADKLIRYACAALAAGMFGYLVQGMTDNVWYNYRIAAYFWFIMALGGALYGLSNEHAPGGAIKANDKVNGGAPV